MPIASQGVYPMFVEPYFRANIAGTITPQHLHLNRNALLAGGIVEQFPGRFS